MGDPCNCLQDIARFLEHRAEKWTRFSAKTMLSFKKEASGGKGDPVSRTLS